MDEIKTKEPAAPEAMSTTTVQPIGSEQLIGQYLCEFLILFLKNPIDTKHFV